MRLATVLLLLAVPATPAPAALGDLLATLAVPKAGAVEVCLSGSKPKGAALLFRVEVWRGQRQLGAVEVPDRDARAAYAQCRALGVSAVRGDALKVYSLGTRPTSLSVAAPPAGWPE